MSGAPVPQFIPAPFGVGAANINYPIPAAQGSPSNSASWQGGFPAVTMEEEIAGGLPPLGQDFNGILYTLSQATYAAQAGQLYPYNAGFAATISGYAAGALLAMGDGTGVWMNVVNGNTGDPDSTPVDWVSLYSYGYGLVTTTGGTTTLNQNQLKRYIIRVQGALTSAATILLPDTIGDWLISNETTGAHALNVAMVSDLSTVVVPQTGMSAPTGVYSPDGSNCYATSVTTAGLAPIASPAFTGSPTCPTQALGNSTTLLANTAFVNRGGTYAQTGGRRNPDGTIENWGKAYYNGSGGTLAVAFTIPYISACYVCNVNASIGGYTPGINALSTTTVTFDMSSLGGTPQYLWWHSIGK
jgi:hypothetical protein